MLDKINEKDELCFTCPTCDGGNKYYLNENKIDHRAKIYNMIFVIIAFLLAIGAGGHILHNLANENFNIINLFELIYLLIFGVISTSGK